MWSFTDAWYLETGVNLQEVNSISIGFREMKLSPRTKTGVPGRFQKALPMVASVVWKCMRRNLQVLAALTSLMRWREGFASQQN